jgi:hypothetical protein
MTYYFIIFVFFIFLSFYLAIRDANKFQKKLDNYDVIIQEIRELSEKIQKVHIDSNDLKSRSVNEVPVRLVFTKDYALYNLISTRRQEKPYYDSLNFISDILITKTYNIKKINQFKNKYS